MDSLTQIVLGASVGEVVLGKKVGNRAMLWGAIAGTIPDLDVIFKQLSDIVTANEMHRGFTHSILFSIVVAPILGWLVHRIYRQKWGSWRGWSMLMFWCLFTHPLLDAHTTWGTQLFWPFEYRVSYQNIFVVDPAYTLPFLGFTTAAIFFKRTNPLRTRLNRIGLLISSAYMLLTIVLKAVTYPVFQKSLEEQNIEYTRMMTRPTPLNCILWTATVETDSAYYTSYYSLFDSDKSISHTKFKKNLTLRNKHADSPLIKRLKKMSVGWYMVTEKEDQLYFYDLRFGQAGINRPDREFIFKYKILKGSDGFSAEQVDPKFEEAQTMFSELFDRVKGKK